MNVTSDTFAGISAANRRALTMLHRAFNRPFDTALAASALNADLAKTRRLLADLADGGWLARVRQGWYITVPIDAPEPRQWHEDPWIVATVLFAPLLHRWLERERALGLHRPVIQQHVRGGKEEGQADRPDHPGEPIQVEIGSSAGVVWNPGNLAPRHGGHCVRSSPDRHRCHGCPRVRRRRATRRRDREGVLR